MYFGGIFGKFPIWWWWWWRRWWWRGVKADLETFWKNNIRFGGDRLPLVCFAVYEVVFAAASRCQQVIGSLSNDSRERGEQRAEYPAMHSFCYFLLLCIFVFLYFCVFVFSLRGVVRSKLIWGCHYIPVWEACIYQKCGGIFNYFTTALWYFDIT